MGLQFFDAVIDTALWVFSVLIMAGIFWTVGDLIARSLWRREQNKRIGKDA